MSVRYIPCPKCGAVRGEKQMRRHMATHSDDGYVPRRKRVHQPGAPRPCKCGCGKLVAQTCEKPKEFVNRAHWQDWARATKANGTHQPRQQAATAEAREEAYMEPIHKREARWEEALRASDERMIAGHARSLALWFEVLEVAHGG